MTRKKLKRWTRGGDAWALAELTKLRGREYAVRVWNSTAYFRTEHQ